MIPRIITDYSFHVTGVCKETVGLNGLYLVVYIDVYKSDKVKASSKYAVYLYIVQFGA